MAKNPKFFLDHILESIHLIEDYVKDADLNDFMASIRMQDLVMRRLEIIGEAVKNLTQDLKNEYPDIEWKKISGMRDVLIHQYFGIDLRLTWNVVKQEIPKLKEKITNILNDIKK